METSPNKILIKYKEDNGDFVVEKVCLHQLDQVITVTSRGVD